MNTTSVVICSLLVSIYCSLLQSLITSKTGKKLSDITLDEVKRGNVQAEDIKISPEMLKRQGQVAKEADNPQMEANFQRASELANVPDEVILNMYNKLRPNRSTKKELILLSS